MSRPAVLALDGGLQLSLNHVHLPQSVWSNHIGCEPSSYAEGLRYNLPASRPLAATVLSDASPSPSALYIIPPGAGPDYRSTRTSAENLNPLPPDPARHQHSAIARCGCGLPRVTISDLKGCFLNRTPDVSGQAFFRVGVAQKCEMRFGEQPISPSAGYSVGRTRS